MSINVTQSGGINFGVGNTISQTGDIVGGDKNSVGSISEGTVAIGRGAQVTTTSGPAIHGNVRGGRDTNIATDQTITNTERVPPARPKQTPQD